MQRLTRYGFVGLGLVALASCGASLEDTTALVLRDRLSQVPGLNWLATSTPIAAISQHREGTVQLSGQVDQHLPLVGQNLYQLTDDSGSVWVLTPDPLPPVGESLTIQATIRYEVIMLQGQDIGEYYAEELSRY